MADLLKLKRGDSVAVEVDDERIIAEVLLVSPNHESLMLQFEAIFARHVGMMPLLYQDGEYTCVADPKLTAKLSRPH